MTKGSEFNRWYHGCSAPFSGCLGLPRPAVPPEFPHGIKGARRGLRRILNDLVESMGGHRVPRAAVVEESLGHNSEAPLFQRVRKTPGAASSCSRCRRGNLFKMARKWDENGR